MHIYKTHAFSHAGSHIILYSAHMLLMPKLEEYSMRLKFPRVVNRGKVRAIAIACMQYAYACTGTLQLQLYFHLRLIDEFQGLTHSR